jgi:hypothetical protein
MPRRNKYFYGDDGGNDGNDVDIAQRHAGNFYGDDTAEPVVKAALAARPKAINNDSVKAKRVEDEIRGAMAGIGTTPDDEALMRQENVASNRTNEPVPDEHTAHAEQITRSLERSQKYSGLWGGMPNRAEFVRGLAEKLRGGPATPATQPEEQEKPFSSNEFWNDREEVQKAAKQVRPRKL